LTTRCLTVTGGGSVGARVRLNQPSWLLGALMYLHTDDLGDCCGLVRVDSSDIVDKKLKLILGLIWTLILHYSISMPVWDDDENRGELPEQTPKQRLLGWIQNKQPDKPVTNFTTDWNDGRAIGALVDGIAPGNTTTVTTNSNKSVVSFRLALLDLRRPMSMIYLHSGG